MGVLNMCKWREIIGWSSIALQICGVLKYRAKSTFNISCGLHTAAFVLTA
jgi:hypothetical protein